MIGVVLDANAVTCYRWRAGHALTNRRRTGSLHHNKRGDIPMSWTRPKLREICIGMEINGYFAAKI